MVGLALLEVVRARSVGDRQRVCRLSSLRVHDRRHGRGEGGDIFVFVLCGNLFLSTLFFFVYIYILRIPFDVSTEAAVS